MTRTTNIGAWAVLAVLVLVLLTPPSQAFWCCHRHTADTRAGYPVTAPPPVPAAFLGPISSNWLSCSGEGYSPMKCVGGFWEKVPHAQAVGCLSNTLYRKPCAMPIRGEEAHAEKDLGMTPRWLYPAIYEAGTTPTFRRARTNDPLIDAYLPREYITPMPTDPIQGP